MFTAEELRARGWVVDADGLWRRPAGETPVHVHSSKCTVESCGEDALFFCAGEACIRALRQGTEKPCSGHHVPTRQQLVEYSLRRRGLAKAAPRGTPLDEDEVDHANTWSAEREGGPR